MKKLVYLLIVIGTIFTGCNPLEDINDDIDAVENPIVGILDYTLIEDDYTELELDNTYFESVEAAKLALPGFLSGKYPNFGQGSTINVGYNLFVGDAEGVSDFITSDTYSLQNSDYTSFGSDAFGFYPNEEPSDFIPAILDAQISDPVEDQLVLATFQQYVSTPQVGLANIYQATFPTDYDSFELVSVSGLDELGWTVGGANVQGSGYDGGANAVEEWLISPEIDLTGQSDLKFQITQEIDFLGDDTLIDVMISADYTTGTDPMTATWTALSFDKTIYGDLTTSEDFDFSTYDGETIHVGLKYSSTDSDSPRWRVQDFAVRAVGVEGETENLGEYYTYSGTEWELTDGVYYLSSADYDSMGEEFGQPGRFDNFSNSVAPENYLPQFLNIKYPFAQEEDEIFIIYNFYNGGLSRQGNLYTFTEAEWMGDTDVIATTLQFGFSDGIWEPDNTIAYTLVQSDYDAIVAGLGETYPDATESMGNYSNFERRVGNVSEWTNSMVLEALNIVLDNINPSAEEAQKYVVTVAIYDGSVGTESFAVIKEGGVWVYQ
jgi:hypothetical protein